MPRAKLTDRTVSGAKSDKRLELWDTTQPGLGLRVEPTGRKFWQLMIGRQRRKIGTFPTWSLKEARKQARAMLQASESGEDPFASRVLRFTVEQLAERFLVEYAERNHSPSWIQDQKNFLKRHIYPTIGSKDIRNVQRGDISEIVFDIARTAPYSANRVRSMLSKIFSWAVGMDFIETSPVIGVPRAAKEVARQRSLSRSDAVSFWRACELDATTGSRALLVALATAQRPGEVCRMRWDAIDDGWWHITRTKSGRDHQIFVTPFVESVITSVPKLGEWVFTSRRSRKSHFAHFNKTVARLHKAMPDLEHWTARDLRRTAATHMARLGVDPFVVSRVLNHADPRGVTQVYDRYSYDDQIRQALELWSSELQSWLEEPTPVEKSHR